MDPNNFHTSGKGMSLGLLFSSKYLEGTLALKFLALRKLVLKAALIYRQMILTAFPFS